MRLTTAVSPNTPTYSFEAGGAWLPKAPSYCEPPKSAPGNNLPDFGHLDLSSRCLPQGLGNCCVTWIPGDKREPLGTADLRDLEMLVRFEAGLEDNQRRTKDLGKWQLERARYWGEKREPSEELFKTWNLGIWSFHTGKKKKEISQHLDTAIFQSGNETVGEQRITIKRHEKRK